MESKRAFLDITENEMNRSIIYQIKIQGQLREKWMDWFNGKVVKMSKSGEDSNNTTILVSVSDQAALRGVMNRIWDLNLTLLSVELIKEDADIGGINEY